MSLPALQPAAAPTALSDEEVVARVLAGDTSLFEILMRRYNQRLFRVTRGILADDAEAEDVTQEAYVRAFRELAKFRGEASFSTWLTRIACHEALARSRKRRRLVPIDGIDGGGGPPTEETADALGLTVENARVRLHRAKRSLRQTLDERIGREVRRLYLFDGARCDRMVEGVFAHLFDAAPSPAARPVAQAQRKL
jgi:RNA polymerase sigma-70 factor (ECF subfamily)